MRKGLKVFLLLCISFALNIAVAYAEENNTVILNVHIGDIEDFKVSNAEMELLNKDNERLGVLNLEIDAVNVDKTITFITDSYTKGEEFYLKPLNNVDCILYESEYYGINSRMLLKTAPDYVDENGKNISGNVFNMTAYPLSQQKIKLRHNFREYKTEYPVKLVNSDCMISLVDVMNIYNLWDNKTVFDDVTGKLEIKTEDASVTMTLGSNEAMADEAVALTTAPLRINTLMYVPLRFTLEALGAQVVADYENGILNVNAITSKNEFCEKEAHLNSINITSKTGYLIWIDKSEFSVTLFAGSKNNWSAVNSYPCSIGAPKTPTITGQFEYYSKEKRWSYPKYYVGPIMRFYNGYALHSTLVKYDGTDYDARTGKMISLGCIRMRPDDIQYLWDNIPLYTRIYVTE